MTKYVIVNQHLKNYEQWKPVFDRSEELRHEYGVGADTSRETPKIPTRYAWCSNAKISTAPASY